MSRFDICRHYTRGGLLDRLLVALARSGHDPDRLAPEDLEGFDEMHVGGRAATRSLGELLALGPGMQVLDIGSGLGGAARYFALAAGCHVTGIDLTFELVAAARELTRRVGLAHRVHMLVADACQLPFSDESFDAAYTIHVGMNIADKPGFYRQAARVLKPDANFALFDLVRARGEPDLPVPWAESPQMSHLVSVDELVALVEAAGLRVVALRDRSAFARESMQRSHERALRLSGESGGSAPIVMGERFREKIAHLAAALADGRLGACELLARRT